MKCALSIALACLLAAALPVPSAQASRVDPQHSRYRFFQDLSMTSPFPGRIFLGVLFKENRHGELTPRQAVSERLQVGVSCNPGGNSVFSIAGNAFSKYGSFSEVLTKGRFFHTFGSEVSEAAGLLINGHLSGTVLKRLKRGGRVVRTARVDGSFNLEDWDPSGPTGVLQNCTSSGSFSASPCKTPHMSPTAPNYGRWKRWKVPKCYTTPW